MTVIPITPSGKSAALTPSDTMTTSFNDNPARIQSIYIGGAGDLKYKNEKGDDVTIQGLAAGTLLPVNTDFVYATGTTATNLVANYFE